MNLPNIILENKFTKSLFIRNVKLSSQIIAFVVTPFFAGSAFAWDIDFSHHQMAQPAPATIQNTDRVESVELPKANSVPVASPIASTSEIVPDLPVTTGMTTTSEIVILNTENGFVPQSISLHAGRTYSLHVINVNEKQKNVSFVMDSFNQYQSTYFNELKTFSITPTTEGNYTFQCPETNFEGHALVLGTSITAQPTVSMGPAPTTKSAWPTSAPDVMNSSGSNVMNPAVTKPTAPFRANGTAGEAVDQPLREPAMTEVQTRASVQVEPVAHSSSQNLEHVPSRNVVGEPNE